jgi:hypothetical protein
MVPNSTHNPNYRYSPRLLYRGDQTAAITLFCSVKSLSGGRAAGHYIYYIPSFSCDPGRLTVVNRSAAARPPLYKKITYYNIIIYLYRCRL